MLKDNQRFKKNQHEKEKFEIKPKRNSEENKNIQNALGNFFEN